MIELRDAKCGGKAVCVAKKIEREPSYVSRMMYPAGKAGKKRIGDDIMELIESRFDLPRGWMECKECINLLIDAALTYDMTDPVVLEMIATATKMK